MKARNKEVSANPKSTPARTLQAPGTSDRRATKAAGDDHSVATWKNYADSRLRQFCLR